MISRSFETLLKIMNAELQTLNEEGYRRYDNENLDHYVSGYHYNQEEGKILVDFEEE